MRNRWVYRVYNGLLVAALPLILAGVFLRWRKRIAKGLDRWPERWGHLSSQQRDFLKTTKKPRWWWVHAVSLGEVKAIEVFLKEIPKCSGARVLLSVVTPEALEWASTRSLADLLIAAPLDLPWVVRRAFREVEPEVFVSVESEFWPNLVREARRCGARVALVNGRISERSFKSYRRIRGLLPAVWECFDLLAVRQSEDASRFAALGVDPRKIRVTGNLKYDLPLPPPKPERSADNQRTLILVIGSSREGEEEILLPVMERLRSRFKHLKVVWAPRHLERVSEIIRLFDSMEVQFQRRSHWDGKVASAAASSGSSVGARPEMHPFDGMGLMSENAPAHLIWDSMGTLGDAYRQADIAVVGGSFVPKGGQNPLEPAALSLPVVFGPSMENFHGIADVLVQQGGARQVVLSDLESCLEALMADPGLRLATGRRARAAVESRQGATARTLKLMTELLGG